MGFIFNFGFPFRFNLLDFRIVLVEPDLLASFRVSDGFFWSFAYGLPKGCSLFCDLLARGWHRKMTLDCVFPGHVWINFCVSNFWVAWCLMRVWMLVCPAVVASGDGACDEDVSAVSLSGDGIVQVVFCRAGSWKMRSSCSTHMPRRRSPLSLQFP